MKHHNRRNFHRIKYDGKANVKFVNCVKNYCQIENLSLTGMFVSGDFNKQHDESCFISFVLNGNLQNIEYLKVSGQIAWLSKEGIGIKFTSSDFDSYMSLVTTLINNAKQPAVILGEIPKDCPFEILNEEQFLLQRDTENQKSS